MTTENIKYLSEAVLGKLSSDVEKNLSHYREGDFKNLVKAGGWSIELNRKADLGILKGLDAGKGAEAEITNSLLVWQALGPLTPALACEARIWTRLTHVEGLEFSRKRWLGQEDDEKLVDSVKTHFFASTRTMIRDDNAIGRLWWNAHIANLAMPGDQKLALSLFLKKADYRLNFVERSRTASRPPIAAGIIRTMKDETWLDSAEENFRYFMRALNKHGGGVMFEIMSPKEVDDFMVNCVEKAKMLQKSKAA
jgi:hypothetical protein